MKQVHLKRTRRLHGGHLWVFSNELSESPKKYNPGELVEVRDMQDGFIGIGYINPNSLIAVRLLSGINEAIDKDFLGRRIRSAVDLRKLTMPDSDAFRVIYSEGDYLPGLIVDKYGSCLVVQFLTSGMEALRTNIIDILDEQLKPETIVLRNDSRVRSLEGLPLSKEVVKGSIEIKPVINEDGVLFEIDLMEGQKTGFFLDQRENRVCLKKYIQSGRGLDLFSYVGAWSMHLASAGAEITCVDSSGKALEQAARNAGLNNLSSRIRFAVYDVFEHLEKELQHGGKTYDFVVLDPPAFVKSAGRLKEAVRAYRQINELSMRLIKSGGILATSSCSYHLGRDLFTEMLNAAAKNAGRRLRLLEFRSQSPDHPVLFSMPETEYLKTAFLLVD